MKTFPTGVFLVILLEVFFRASCQRKSDRLGFAVPWFGSFFGWVVDLSQSVGLFLWKYQILVLPTGVFAFSACDKKITCIMFL